MSKEEIIKKGKFYTIVDGSFRTVVPQDHPEAVRRDWESSDGKTSGTKYERIINSLFGIIEEVSFQDGDYGMQVLVKLDPNEDGDSPIIALATSSREGEDFLKKLPNINLEREVRLRPFNFEGSRGEKVRGMEIMQQDENDEFKAKIVNFFTVKEGENWVNKHGYPDPESSDMTKDEWKLYFLQARMFLIKYIKQNIVPKFGVLEAPEQTEDTNADAEFASMGGEAEGTPTETLKKFKPKSVKKAEEIKPDDIPF